MGHFVWSAPVAFRRVALETPEWTSRDSNHHRQSVSAGKTNAIPTEPSGRLTALNGSDIVYSRELQTGAIRKLQMLLKKIRVGLDPRSDKEPLHEITAAFDSGHRSVVRTPMVEAHAPSTPMPAAEPSREPQDAPTECKVETSLHDLCMIASSETAPFAMSYETKA